MDCAKGLALLSDFHDALLDDTDSTQVQLHLSDCPTCDGVFRELKIIVLTAVELRDGSTITFPDENIFWERLATFKQEIH